MKKPVDFEKARQKKSRHKKFLRFFILLLIIVLAVLAYVYRYEIASQGFGVLVSDEIASLTKTSAYPVDLAATPQQLICVGSRPAVSADGTVTIYNSVGEEKSSTRLGTESTLMACAGNYLLMYARGGYEMRILSGETELFHLQTDDAIRTAAISKNGSAAVVTARGSSSTVYVYSRKYNKVFEWSTSAFTVTALSLDDAGRTVAVGGLRSDNGMLSSTLREFSVTTGEELLQKDFPDEMLLEIRRRTDGALAVITDGAAYAIDTAGEKSIDFSSSPVAYAIFDDGSVAVATGDYLSAHEVRLFRTDAELTKTSSATMTRSIKRLLPYGDDVMIFTGERVLQCSEQWERVATYETAGALQTAVCGKSLYYTTVSRLCRLSLK